MHKRVPTCEVMDGARRGEMKSGSHGTVDGGSLNPPVGFVTSLYRVRDV